MKKRLYFIAIILSSCLNRAFVNNETSAIGGVYAECLEKGAWDTLFLKYSINKIHDPSLEEILVEFKSKPFNTDILYLDEPKELIAISDDRYMVRYLYNPKLSHKILDGFMMEQKEKNRVLNRVQRLLMDYQCENGKVQSLNSIKEREE